MDAALVSGQLSHQPGRHRAPKSSVTSKGQVARRVGVVSLLVGPAWALGATTLTSAAIAAPASCSSVGVGAQGEVVKAIQRTVGRHRTASTVH
jgi:hypothetical protein